MVTHRVWRAEPGLGASAEAAQAGEPALAASGVGPDTGEGDPQGGYPSGECHAARQGAATACFTSADQFHGKRSAKACAGGSAIVNGGEESSDRAFE